MKAPFLPVIIVILTTFTSDIYSTPINLDDSDISNHEELVGGENFDVDLDLLINDDSERIKRSAQPQKYSGELVFSPDFGYGYYVFPRSLNHQQQSSYEYNPIVKYKSTKTKRKKLFVPNLFG